MFQFSHLSFLGNLRASPLARLFRYSDTTDSGASIPLTGGTQGGLVSDSGTLTDTGVIVDTGALQGRLLYDKNGNLIGNLLNNKRQFEYVYDAQNRMIQVNRYNEVTGKEVLITFTYDALGRRTSKKVANVVYEYIYSGNDVIEETQSNINPTTGNKVKQETREYTYGASGTDDVVAVRYSTYDRVKKVDVLITTGDYYYEKNHLGSIIRITSSTGAIVDEYSYTVFGKPYKKNSNGVYKSVSGSNKSAINNTRLFTGREYDREISLYYLRARYYDANLGRFVSRDPIGMRDNINLYTYVANSPVKYVDRMGLEKALIITFAGHDSFGFGEIASQNYGEYGLGLTLNSLGDNFTTKFYNSSLFDVGIWGNEVDQAYQYIKDNKGKFNKLIILGHSLGADNAVELSQLLDEDNINVDLLLTIDLQAGWDTTNVPDSVKIAKNYYQTNWDSVVNGDSLQQDGGAASFVSNVIVNNHCDIQTCNQFDSDYKLGHTSIDGDISSILVQDINSVVR